MPNGSIPVRILEGSTWKINFNCKKTVQGVMTETNVERLENIHSKCLEQIEKYIDAKTKAASAMTTELDIVHEVGQAMKVLGEGVAANKTAIKGEEDCPLSACGSLR